MYTPFRIFSFDFFFAVAHLSICLLMMTTNLLYTYAYLVGIYTRPTINALS